VATLPAAPMGDSPTAPRRRPWLLLTLHWFIIINFLIQILYAAWIVFFVLAPEGGGGPLFGQAAHLDHELVVKRRMYAHETWLAIGGLAIYLAVTEIGPRLRRHRGF